MKYFLLERNNDKWLIEQTDIQWRSIFYYDGFKGKYVHSIRYTYSGNVEEWMEESEYVQTLTPTTLEQFIADNFSDIL